MNINELNNKARLKAIETVSYRMKSHSDQYGMFLVSEIEKFIEKNKLDFDKDGNIKGS